MPNRLVTVLLGLAISLAACNQNRADDIAPVPANIPTSTAETAPAAEPPAGEVAVIQANTNPEPLPATSQALTLSIEGGIVGFCDTLTLTATGEYTLTSCGQESVSGTLPQTDLDSLQSWVSNLTNFDIFTQDNPDGPDSMVTNLNFEGQGNVQPDQAQQQVIFDWANILVARLRPQQLEVTPPPAPIAGGLCPDVSRPALILSDFDNPAILIVTDPAGQATCQLETVSGQPPAGRLVSAGGNLYYPVSDPAAKTVTVWQTSPNGEQTPLDFTAVTMAERMPYDFMVSEDGSKIAWGHTLIDASIEPKVYQNSLWLANSDGSNPVTVLDSVQNEQLRLLSLNRFGPDGTLYYALQPDIGGPLFTGRLDTLYSVLPQSNAPNLVYACPEDNPFCIGGLAWDGSVISVVQPTQNAVEVLDRAGAVLASIPIPATDYVERTTFGPDGSLAFVSATLKQPEDEDMPALPNPGIITVAAPPYTNPQTLYSDNSVATVWGWLDDTRLTFGAISPDQPISTMVINTDGQVNNVAPYIAIGILR